MARDNLFFGTGLLASPNQASTLFTPGIGPHPIRQKHLFAVRFMRAATPGTSLQGDLTFVVKSIDRPQVQPQIEEVNQYNKKRLIHTGVKYSPVSCTLYDTADGAAMNMWLDYARYYFGDYNQPFEVTGQSNANGFSDDIINPEFNDPTSDKSNFGFNIRQPGQNDFSIEGTNSQFYFSSVRVYQLWGNEYTSYDLVNPRINTFIPDDLDYANSEVNTIQLSISYEAIGHHAKGMPQDVFTERSLAEMFRTGPFNGNVLEVSGPPRGAPFAGIEGGGFLGGSIGGGLNLGGILGGALEVIGGELGLNREFTNSVGGVLNRFGVFDFGTVDQTHRTHLIDDVQQAIGGSNSLSSLLGGAFSGSTSSLDRAGDQTRAAVGKEALQLDGMARSINVAAKRTGTSPIEQTERDGGLSLSEEAVSAFNEPKDGTFFMGFRKDV
jgi:hypothetical protein